MHRLSIAALVLVLAGSPAHADNTVAGTLRKVSDLWTSTQEGEIRRKLEQAREQIEAAIAVTNAFLVNNQPIAARVDVFAEAGGGLDARAVAFEGTVGAVFAVSSERCDVIQAGLSLRADLRSRSPHGLGGAQQWVQLCLSGGLDVGSLMETSAPGFAIFPLVLRESALMLARPRLTAPRSAIDEDYSDIGYGFDVEGARWLWRPDHGMGFIGFTADQRYRWRHFYGGEKVKTELSGNIWFVRLLHTRSELALADRFIDFFAIDFHGIQADNGAAIIGFYPMRIYGLGPFGTDLVLVDADLGFGGTGTLGSDVNGPGVHEMTTIESTGLPDIDYVIAHGALHIGHARQSLSAAYDRTVDTNVLADVITEQRFTLSGTYTEPAWVAHAAAFVSKANYYLDEETTAEERIVGAAFTGSYSLPHQLQLGLTLEAAFGLNDRDPVLDGRVLPRGLRGFLTLGTTRTIWESK
ncbi:hypothetical protein BH11MYX3_BH11MYX3_15680 [soil metagenome]